MTQMQQLEREVKKVLIESLNLEDYSIDDIKSEEPLFEDGLGLDSIDALELGIAIKKSFNINLDLESDMTKHFYSVETLANYIKNCKNASEVAVED